MGRMKRGWREASGLSLADLKRLCEQKEAEVSSMAERRDELAAELADLDKQLAGAGSGGGRARRGRKRRAGRRRSPGRPRKARKVKAARRLRRGRKARRGARGPRGEGGLQNMIRKVLGGASEPMKLADLAQALLDGGYKTSSPRFGVIVGQRLSEMKDVKRAGRGLYTVRGR